jgi:hypothetical protein
MYENFLDSNVILGDALAWLAVEIERSDIHVRHQWQAVVYFHVPCGVCQEMTLHDQYGEVEVGIGDLFEMKTGPAQNQFSATLAVVCPEPLTFKGQPIICVRLKQGVLEHNGSRFEYSEERNNLLFNLTGDQVARLIREHRLMTFDIPAPQLPQLPQNILDEKVIKPRRASDSKKPARKHEPNQSSLF